MTVVSSVIGITLFLLRQIRRERQNSAHRYIRLYAPLMAKLIVQLSNTQDILHQRRKRLLVISRLETGGTDEIYQNDLVFTIREAYNVAGDINDRRLSSLLRRVEQSLDTENTALSIWHGNHRASLEKAKRALFTYIFVTAKKLANRGYLPPILLAESSNSRISSSENSSRSLLADWEDVLFVTAFLRVPTDVGGKLLEVKSLGLIKPLSIAKLYSKSRRPNQKTYELLKSWESISD